MMAPLFYAYFHNWSTVETILKQRNASLHIIACYHANYCIMNKNDSLSCSSSTWTTVGSRHNCRVVLNKFLYINNHLCKKSFNRIYHTFKIFYSQNTVHIYNLLTTFKVPNSEVAFCNSEATFLAKPFRTTKTRIQSDCMSPDKSIGVNFY